MKGSIRQRSPGHWELTVDLGKDNQGRRQRRFATVRGSKAQAQRKLRELLSAVDQGLTPPNRELRLGDWLERWLSEWIAPRRRESTLIRYEAAVRRHIAPRLGHVRLAALGPADIRAFEAQLLAQGLSPQSVGQAHVVLSGALNYALRMELIARNPVAAVSPPRPARREAQAPEPDAVRALLRLAQNEDYPGYPILRLIAYTGLRRGEALALRRAHLNLDEGWLLVRGSLARAGRGRPVLEPPKTASGARKVDLDAGTVRALAQHLAGRPPSEIDGEQGIVFPDPATGGWMNPARLSRDLAKLARRAGHSGITLRSLRHFHASVALQQGQNIVVISKRLGHSSVSITGDIYAHSLPGWQKEAADAFAAAMDADDLP